MLYTVKNTYDRKTGKKISQTILEEYDKKSPESFYEEISKTLAEDAISKITQLNQKHKI